MERFTKDRALTIQENMIKDLIKSDIRYYEVFKLLYNYYRLDYLRGKSNYFLVFKAIYVEDIKRKHWDYVDCCHVSKTTLYDYRHEIIDFFYTCINDNIVMEEIVVSKG